MTKGDIQWISTYRDFLTDLSNGEVSHESWFRNQQKLCRENKLQPYRVALMEAFYPQSWAWSSMQMVALKTQARSGQFAFLRGNGIAQIMMSVLGNAAMQDPKLKNMIETGYYCV